MHVSSLQLEIQFELFSTLNEIDLIRKNENIIFIKNVFIYLSYIILCKAWSVRPDWLPHLF